MVHPSKEALPTHLCEAPKNPPTASWRRDIRLSSVCGKNRNRKSRNERTSMKLGFICIGLPGHLNPMTALARQLQARSHEVVFLYSSGAAGLPFVPGPEKDHINENRPEVSKKQGEDALRFSLRAVLAQTEAILKSLPAIVQANGIDALIIDTVQFYAELGAMQLGIPYLHLPNALPLDSPGYPPLCRNAWPHATPPAALARNREAVAKWTDLLNSLNGDIKARAESVGLKIDWNNLDSTASP